MKTEIYTIPIQDAFAEEKRMSGLQNVSEIRRKCHQLYHWTGCKLHGGEISGSRVMNRASVRNIWKCYMNIRIN